MVRTQVQLTNEQVQELKRMAADRGVSMAEIIRQSIDAFMRTPGLPSQAELRRRALLAAGSLRGGPSDLAKRHDEYLVEAYEQ